MHEHLNLLLRKEIEHYPRCGFIENIWTNFKNEKIIPAAKAPSDNNIGSKGDHCSRGYQGLRPAIASRRTV